MLAVPDASAHSTILPGQLIVGGWVSMIWTVCTQVAVLPELSVAVQVTKVVPRGNWLGALLLTEAVPQLALYVGTPRGTPVA